MSSAKEHYREAERLLDIVGQFQPHDVAWAQATATAANAHALLALAASHDYSITEPDTVPF